MLYRLRRAFQYWRYNRLVYAIEDTPPLTINDSPLRIVSLVAVPRDLRMYLVAAKVLYRRLGHGRFVVIPDRPLAPEMRDLILRHLGGGAEFRDLASLPVGRCQRGGCWERLVACLDLSAEHYVIQMDSDTLALGDIPEVREAVRANRAFTLCEGIPLQTMAEAAAWVRAHVREPRHIVDVAQAAFSRFPGADRLFYLRASAGFTGFARGGFRRADIETFHATMEDLVGHDKWREWGTEQVASNFAVANSPDPVALPHPDYANVTASTNLADLRFGHFIGSYRFHKQILARASVPLIEALRTGASLP
ncbi:hypothetical protein [Elioraea thermophila]|uniref:hypothetical protein n=1 Tax=Elioraea thermophila TaxID=2185104 RepID=UPI000DF3C2F2|nr:hypothetical protein [Elioraea thermophila]